MSRSSRRRDAAVGRGRRRGAWALFVAGVAYVSVLAFLRSAAAPASRLPAFVLPPPEPWDPSRLRAHALDAARRGAAAPRATGGPGQTPGGSDFVDMSPRGAVDLEGAAGALSRVEVEEQANSLWEEASTRQATLALEWWNRVQNLDEDELAMRREEREAREAEEAAAKEELEAQEAEAEAEAKEEAAWLAEERMRREQEEAEAACRRSHEEELEARATCVHCAPIIPAARFLDCCG